MSQVAEYSVGTSPRRCQLTHHPEGLLRHLPRRPTKVGRELHQQKKKLDHPQKQCVDASVMAGMRPTYEWVEKWHQINGYPESRDELDSQYRQASASASLLLLIPPLAWLVVDIWCSACRTAGFGILDAPMLHRCRVHKVHATTSSGCSPGFFRTRPCAPFRSRWS